jgi:hypothetical protein
LEDYCCCDGYQARVRAGGQFGDDLTLAAFGRALDPAKPAPNS